MAETAQFHEHSVRCASIRGDASHRMVYSEWGDPENPRVLICVHGLTRTGRDFDQLAATLAPHYRVVCPDVVGRGRSERLTHARDYGFTQYFADMMTLIARLDVPSVHWLGTSMGGRIGMAVAALPESPVTRLVLNDIGPRMSRDGLRHIVTYLGEDPSFASFDEAVAYVKAVSQPFGQHSEEQWRFLTEHCVCEHQGRWQFIYDPAISPFYSTSPWRSRLRRLLARQLLGLLPRRHPMFDQWALYDRIRCPTLAIRGAQSALLARRDWLEMAERGPCARLAEIEGVGHAPTFLNPETIRIAADFLLAK